MAGVGEGVGVRELLGQLSELLGQLSELLGSVE